jgi:hypothetical protein
MGEADDRNEPPAEGRVASTPSSATPVGPSDERESDELPGVDQLIGTFIDEPSLWPVLAVAVGSGGAFAAALMILAVVDRNPFAAAALVLLLGMTIDVVFRARTRPSHRNGARLLLSIWTMGFVLVGVALWSGIAFAG